MRFLQAISFICLMVVAATAQAQVVTNYMPAGASPDDALWQSVDESDLPSNRPGVRYFGDAISPSAQVAVLTSARRLEANEPTPADPRFMPISYSQGEPTPAEPNLITLSGDTSDELPLTNIQQAVVLQPVPTTPAPTYRPRRLFPRVRGLMPANTTPTSQAYVLPNTVYSATTAQQVYASPGLQQVAYDPCTCQPIQCQPVQGATYTTAQTVLMPQANQCAPYLQVPVQTQQPVQLQAVPAATAPQLGQTVVPAQQVAAAYPTTRQRIGPLIPLRRQIPEGTWIGQGILGQPTAFVDGQPVRNFIRYLTL